MYFYSGLIDGDYYAGLEREGMNILAQADKYIINYGQDFEKYCIGGQLDFDTRRYWQWEGTSIPFTANDVKTLAEYLFNPDARSGSAIMFTPTCPSDSSLSII